VRLPQQIDFHIGVGLNRDAPAYIGRGIRSGWMGCSNRSSFPSGGKCGRALQFSARHQFRLCDNEEAVQARMWSA